MYIKTRTAIEEQAKEKYQAKKGNHLVRTQSPTNFKFPLDGRLPQMNPNIIRIQDNCFTFSLHHPGGRNVIGQPKGGYRFRMSPKISTTLRIGNKHRLF